MLSANFIYHDNETSAKNNKFRFYLFYLPLIANFLKQLIRTWYWSEAFMNTSFYVVLISYHGNFITNPLSACKLSFSHLNNMPYINGNNWIYLAVWECRTSSLHRIVLFSTITIFCIGQKQRWQILFKKVYNTFTSSGII